MMNNNIFLPNSTTKREWRFRPMRTVIVCILIAAVLVSMSVGLSYAKYTSTQGLTIRYNTEALNFDPARYIVQKRVPGEDNVFYTMHNNVRITVPADATGAYLDGAEYLVLRLTDEQNYTVDYSKSEGQYFYKVSYFLMGLSYSNADAVGFTMGNVVDNTSSMSLEMKVGSEYDISLENAHSPRSAQPTYDGEWVKYDNIKQFHASAKRATVYQYSYDKKAWTADNRNADDDIHLDYSGSTVHITDAEDLADVACLVNWGIEDFDGKTLVLDNDISLSSKYDDRLDLNDGTKELRPWTPIGTKDHPFKGSFNGNYCSIDGLNIRNFAADQNYQYNSAGLFGYASSEQNTTISSLSLSNSYISCNLGDTGNSGSMGPAIGGIVGADYGTSGADAFLTISDVHISNLTITSVSKYLGGIMGYGLHGKISGCSVSGLTINTLKTWQVGGIIGLQHGYADTNGAIVGDINVSGCTVSGSIAGAYEIAGGIIGQATDYAVGVEDCSFDGTIYASTMSGVDAVTGGILAQLATTYYTVNDVPTYYISGCSCGDYPKFGGSYHDNVEDSAKTDNYPKVDN